MIARLFECECIFGSLELFIWLREHAALDVLRLPLHLWRDPLEIVRYLQNEEIATPKQTLFAVLRDTVVNEASNYNPDSKELQELLETLDIDVDDHAYKLQRYMERRLRSDRLEKHILALPHLLRLGMSLAQLTRENLERLLLFVASEAVIYRGRPVNWCRGRWGSAKVQVPADLARQRREEMDNQS